MLCRLALSFLLLGLVDVLAQDECDPTTFGAVGDNVTDDTRALQAALASPACSSVVLRAPGLFLSRALDLSNASARSLLIEPGAAIVVWRKRASWGTGTGLLWQSQPGVPIVNFIISGGGAVLGGGSNWWPPANQSNKHAQFRPRAIQASHCIPRKCYQLHRV